MVAKIFGKINGQDLNFEHDKGDFWKLEIPFLNDGEYIIEIFAQDEAGNISYITKALYTIKAGDVHIKILPYINYIFDKIETEYCFAITDNEIIVQRNKEEYCFCIINEEYVFERKKHCDCVLGGGIL